MEPELTIERYGWCTEEDGDMQPITYDGDIAPNHVVDLVQCYCPKSKCRSYQCSCKRNKLVCTECDNYDVYITYSNDDNDD